MLKILMFPFKAIWFISILPFVATWWLIKLPFRILKPLLIGLGKTLQALFGLAIVVALGYGLLLLAGPFFALGGVVGGIMFIVWAVLTVVVEPTVAKMEADLEKERHDELVDAIKETA